MITLNTYILISILLFSIGLFTVFTRKNAISILMGIELMLNAVGLNFVAFNYFNKHNDFVDGHIFTIFIIVLAAAEAVVALAIVLAIYKQRKYIEIDEIKDLKG